MRTKSLFAVALFFGLAGLVRAGDPLDFQGKPDSYDAGKSQRYALWHDDDGWHLRCTTAKNQHKFTGRIAVKGGKFLDVHPVKKEKGDHWKLGPEHHVIEFDFQTDEAEDGLDFRTEKGSDELHWSLKIDGDEKPGHVFMGEKGRHPHEVPFTTPAHPVAEHKREGKGKK